MKINRKHIQNSFVNILGFLFHFIFFLVRFCSVNWARFSIHTILSSILTNCWRVLYIYIQQPEHHSFHQDATDENPIFARTMFVLSVIWELCSARSQTFNRSNALKLLFLLRKCIELEMNSEVCVRVCVCVQKLSVCLQVPVHPNGIIVCTAFTHCTKQMNEKKKHHPQELECMGVCMINATNP